MLPPFLSAATPAEAGFDPDRLAAAITFVQAHESPWRRDPARPIGGRQFRTAAG